MKSTGLRTGLEISTRPENQRTKTLTPGLELGSVLKSLGAMSQGGASPWTVNKALRDSLSVQVKWQPVYAGMKNHSPVAYRMTGDRGLALSVLREMMKPGDLTQIALELGKLAAITKRKATDEQDMKFTIAAYMERFSEIPGDMALYAIRRWPEQKGEMSKWFPAWSELRELFEDALEDRERMLKSL